MSAHSFFVPYFQVIVPFDGEGDPDPKDPDPKAPTTYTQEQFDAALAEKAAAQQELLGELEALKSSSNLNTKQREELEGRVKSLKEQLMTKEQLAEQDRLRIEGERAAEVEGLTKDRDSWKSRFEKTLSNNSILEASTKHDAHNSSQMLRLLGGDSKVEAVLDDEGAPTGEYKTLVTADIYDAKTKESKTITDTPDVVIKAMSGSEEYANLFKNKGTGGVGVRHNNGSTMSLAEAAKTMTPAEYRAYKAKLNS